MKQQVRIGSVSKICTGTLKSHPFPIDVGEGEVIEVLASYLGWKDIESTGGEGHLCSFLYRKSETIPSQVGWVDDAGAWQEDDSIFDWFRRHKEENTVIGYRDLQSFEYKIYPKPVLLIRSPSLLEYGKADVVAFATIWYQLRNASKEELTKLMVKDHA